MTDQSIENQINPNLASLEQLQQLAGVGPNLAERIQQGRPYQEAEDLLGVAGIGQGSLNRWADILTFEGDFEASSEKPGSSDEATKEEPKVAKPRRASPPSKGRQSNDSILWLAIAVLVSVFLSVSLTLGVLLSINGSLNVGRHASVQSVESDLAELQADLTELNSQVESLDQRLEALAGLSSRMAEVEGQVDELEGQMDQALTSVEAMRERFDALEEVTQSLSDRVNRFDQFLDGLGELLRETDPDSPAEPEQEQEGTPSQ